MTFLFNYISGLIDIHPNENVQKDQVGNPAFVLLQLKYPILTTNIVTKINSFVDKQHHKLMGEPSQDIDPTTLEDHSYTYIPMYNNLPLTSCSIM
tara:strand:+ start:2583 stop:2867 length:285 start_codon:yes stop_codon:yes gene_type:complete